MDWDSTINDFDGHFVKTLNEKFGTTHSVEDILDWDWVRNHPDLHVEYMWGKEVFDNKEWNLSIPPKPGAVLALNRLCDAGAIVDVVTARKRSHWRWVQEWLTQNGIYGPFVWVTQDKVAHAKMFGVNAVVEDSPKHIEAFREWGGARVYAIDMLYNRDVREDDLVTRVPSLWEAVEDIFGGTAHE